MLIDGIVLSNSTKIKYENGTDFSANSLYDIAGCTYSKPEAGVTLMRFSVNRPFKLLKGFPDSYAESVVAATGNPVYAIIRDRDGVKVNVGKITFTANAAVFADGDETTDHSFIRR